MEHNCFNCKYRNIIETSHEWIECLCKADHEWHDVYTPRCENYEDKEADDETD